MSFAISCRKTKPLYASVWSLQILKAITTKEFDADYYNLKTGTIGARYDAVMIPNLSYRIEF
jgi:hypothetical protein